ncbi:MAG TPA: hypothetical protein VEC18_10600 [Myxococcota bacterium]|nr:hypothetical protein [Myxococcota bacterium]
MRPDFPEALALLASVALEGDDLETAEAALHRLLALRADATARSQFAALQLRKGARAEQSGDRAAARAHYRAGLELAPRHAPLLRALERVQAAERADANAPSAAPPLRRGAAAPPSARATAPQPKRRRPRPRSGDRRRARDHLTAARPSKYDS